VFKPITKWNHRVSAVEDVPDGVHTSFRKMRTGRQRPVELEIPLDFLAASSEFIEIGHSVPDDLICDKEKIHEAARILGKSEYPLIISGGGVISSNASEELTQLAELLNAPVITTDEGKGSISENNYLSLGSANSAAYTAISRADTYLVIGSRVSPRRNQRLVESGKIIIQIDIDADEIGKNYPVKLDGPHR
jgi:thiamine pyrophosphate-dependent acetolactate synthase large subunit-like protein